MPEEIRTRKAEPALLCSADRMSADERRGTSQAVGRLDNVALGAADIGHQRCGWQSLNDFRQKLQILAHRRRQNNQVGV